MTIRNNRIFPDWKTLHNLNNPLTDGEKALAKFLDYFLPRKWEIYVQPFLNGDRPDIVILNPDVGIMIYEVKDWRLKNYSWKNNKLFVRDSRGSYPVLSPVEQAKSYKENIMNLYIPMLGEKIQNNPKAYVLINIGVYFHNEETNTVKQFFEQDKKNNQTYSTIIGHDSLKNNLLFGVVPDAKRTNSYWLKSEDRAIFNALKTWLNPPFHSKEQGTKIKLTKRQETHSKPNPGHHRIKGAAGSGKTLVIAYRAAKLAEEGNRVLVVTFNMTLWHYIRDQIARTPIDFEWKNIVFKHFHGFCTDQFKNLGIDGAKLSNKDEKEKERDDFFKSEMPNRLLHALKSQPKRARNKSVLKFDAILIDEGQDFYWEWYNLLCHYLTERNELLLVADSRQNIYKIDPSWTGAGMRNVQFRGRWAVLDEKSYRLPNEIVEVLNDFATQFLAKNVEDIPLIRKQQMELFNNPQLIWKNVSTLEKGIKICESAYKFFFEQNVQPSDMVFLLPTHKIGRQLVKIFEDKDIKVNHVFEASENTHHHKKSFWMGDSRLKMSTIHSFKGWELKTIIVLIPPEEYLKNFDFDYLLYTAISRTRKDIFVINCSQKYYEFGGKSYWQRLGDS